MALSNNPDPCSTLIQQRQAFQIVCQTLAVIDSLIAVIVAIVLGRIFLDGRIGDRILAYLLILLTIRSIIAASITYLEDYIVLIDGKMWHCVSTGF